MADGFGFDVGALLGSAISTAGQLYANQKNIQNQNRLFSEQVNLANSAHQREVNDLRLSGLNPILSAQGNGASSPNPSAATVENPLASAAQLVGMQAEAKKADAAETAAENGSWVIYDAKSLGQAGFEVLGFGASAKVHTIQTLRINKVTGDTYDALTGRRVRVIQSNPSSSGKKVPDGEVTVKYLGFPETSGVKKVRDLTHHESPWVRMRLR